MNVRQLLYLLPVLLTLLTAAGSLSGCGETAYSKSVREHAEAYATIDDDSIQHYLKNNNYTTYTRTDDGVYIVPISKGTGPAIATGKQVRVKYVGRVLSINPTYTNYGQAPTVGQVFDNSSENHTACGCIVATVGTGLVSGFSEGLTYLHGGDRALLLIPSQQAYGAAGNASNNIFSIYPDSSLLFDVEVLEVL